MRLSQDDFRRFIQDATKSTRLTNYTLYDNYYKGNFGSISFPSHVADAGSVDVSYHANLCKLVVDAKVFYISGGPIGVTVLTDNKNQEDPKANDAEQFLYDVYKTNEILEAGWIKLNRICAKKGDVFIKCYVDTKNKSWVLRFFEKFKSLWKTEANFAQKIRINVLRPDIVFPYYNTDDYETMEMCAVAYTDADAETGQIVPKLQVWYPEILEIWKYVKDEEDEANDTYKWELEAEEENIYGFIPVIHIKNCIDDTEFGTSDIHNLEEPQYLLNKTLTDLMLAEDYQAFQRIFVIGSQHKRGVKWDVSPGTVNEIPNPDAKVQTIESAELKPLLDTIETIRQLLLTVSMTPEVAVGNIKGGIPSGYALKIHLMPLENKVKETTILMQSAFSKLNKMILSLAATNGHNFGIWDTELQISLGLPIDKLSIVEQHEKQLKNGTISRRTAMQEEGIKDVEAELAQIEKETYTEYPDEEQQRQEIGAMKERQNMPDEVTEDEIEPEEDISNE